MPRVERSLDARCGSLRRADEPAAPPPSRDAQDSIKGVLIAAVVWGHTLHLTQAFPLARHGLYYFHVAGFLLLPFLVTSRPLQARFVADRSARYLVPYAFAFWLSALVYALAFAQPFGAWLLEAIAGFLIGSAELLDRACGFQLYWFLPALWALTLLRSLVSTVQWMPRLCVGAAAVTLHLTLGAVPMAVRPWLWANLGIAAFMLPLGWIVTLITRSPRAVHPSMTLVWGSLAGVSMAAGLAAHSPFNLGKMIVPSYRQPGALLLHDLCIVASFLTLLSAGPVLMRSRLAVSLGRYSLEIFLMHGLLLQGLVLIQRMLGLAPASHVELSISGLIMFVLALAGSFGLAAALHRWVALRRILLPRSVSEWLGREGQHATPAQLLPET